MKKRISLEIEMMEDGFLNVDIIDPNDNAEPIKVPAFPFSPDEHPEFNSAVGNALYDVFKKWGWSDDESEKTIVDIANMSPEDEEDDDLLSTVYAALKAADESNMSPTISNNGIETVVTYGDVLFVMDGVTFGDGEDDFADIDEFVDGILSLITDKFRFNPSDSFRTNFINAVSKAFEGNANRGWTIALCGDVGCFEIEATDDTDDDIAAMRAIDAGVPIIPVDELPETFDRKYLGWVDTPSNRKLIWAVAEGKPYASTDAVFLAAEAEIEELENHLGIS